MASTGNESFTNETIDQQLLEFVKRISPKDCEQLCLTYFNFTCVDVDDLRYDHPSAFGFKMACLQKYRQRQGDDLSLDKIEEYFTQILNKQTTETLSKQICGVGIREDCTKSFIDDFRSLYHRKITGISTHPLKKKSAVEKLPFTELHLRQMKQKLDIRDKSYDVHYEKILQNTKTLETYTDMFKVDQGSDEMTNSFVVVEGQAGSGKSTLCKQIALDWAKGGKPLSDKFDLVLLIELRNVNIQTSFIDQCYRLLGHKYSSEEKPKLEDLIRDKKTLLMFDGFDEISLENYQPSENISVADILINPSQIKSTLLVTTRPHKKDELVGELKHKNIVCAGFNADMARCFIRTYFGQESSSDSADHIISRYLEEHNLSEISRLPITLLFVCYIYHKNRMQILPQSIAYLYQEIVDTLLLHARKVKSLPKPSNAVTSLLRKLGRQSLDKLLKNILHFEEEEILSCITYDELDLLLKAGLLVFDSCFEDLTDQITFVHKTMQEFFAAEHLLSLLTGDAREETLAIDVNNWCSKNIETFDEIFLIEKVLKFLFGKLPVSRTELSDGIMNHILNVGAAGDHKNDWQLCKLQAGLAGQTSVRFETGWIISKEYSKGVKMNAVFVPSEYSRAIVAHQTDQSNTNARLQEHDQSPVTLFLDRSTKQRAFTAKRPDCMDSIDKLTIDGSDAEAPAVLQIDRFIKQVEKLWFSGIDLSKSKITLPRVTQELAFFYVSYSD